MADQRFYAFHGAASLTAIAEVSGATLLPGARGPEAEASGVSTLSDATADELAYFQDERYADQLPGAKAVAIFVREADAEQAGASGAARLVTPTPQASFARASRLLFSPRALADQDTLIHPSAQIGANVRIGPGAVVGADAEIGDDVSLGPACVIGAGVRIGPGSVIGPCAVIGFAVIGSNAKVLAGAVIGESGFGLAGDDKGLFDLPHLGRVLVDDDVTIGANTTIDRGMLADTTVGSRTKIDNLVQIAHNVRIGRDCVIAGCCGLSGSVVLGDNVMLGGSVGVADHVLVGDGARLAGATLVMRDVPAGETWAGAPARPIRTFFREVAALSRLARSKGSRG